MKKIVMIVKKLALLVVMVQPMVVMADVVDRGPFYVYRLRRIGFEILPDHDYSDIGLVVAAFAVGSVILLFSKKNKWKKRALIVISGLCALYVVYWLYGGFFSNYFESLRFIDERLHDYNYSWLHDHNYLTLHHERPGWKYEESLSPREKETIAKKIHLVIDELQQAIYASGIVIRREQWQPDYGRYREERVAGEKFTAIISVLEKHNELRKKCKGIPIEWLMDVIELKEEQYRTHYGE